MGDLSEHFSRQEFACHCGCGMNTIDARTLELCEEVREFTGAPVKVTSGHRCAKHNKRVGGASNSQHLYGRAADLSVEDPKAVFDWLCKQYPGVFGFGLYPSHGFVHVDTRNGTAARWHG